MQLPRVFLHRSPLVPLTAPLLALGLVGCDLETFILDVGLIPGARTSAVSRCCECLASQAPPPATQTLCLAPDGAAPTCLCDATSAECSTTLQRDEAIKVVGECVAADAVCEADCRGVLAFPFADEPEG